MISSAQSDLRLFVDALRGVLGYAPLYAAEALTLCFTEHELAAPEQDRGEQWFRGGWTPEPLGVGKQTGLSVARQRFRRLDFSRESSGG